MGGEERGGVIVLFENIVTEESCNSTQDTAALALLTIN